MVHDFDKDPIRPRVEGDWVRATGTTLGADDGIGIAVSLPSLNPTLHTARWNAFLPGMRKPAFQEHSD